MQSVTMGAFTGTWDNSVNNNNITTTATSGFTGSGTGTRTIKLGTATYTITNGTWNFNQTTNLTYTGNTGANIVMTGATTGRLVQPGGLSHGNLTFAAQSGSGSYEFSSAGTFASITINAPGEIRFPSSSTITVGTSITWNGTSSNQILIRASSTNVASIALPGSQAMTWCGFRDVDFTGSPVATNSFTFGGNIAGITISAPSAGGAASARVIGG